MDDPLVVGLGNPGSKYRGTRHNIGFDVVDRLAERHRVRLSQEKFDGQFGSGRVASRKVKLLEPETYMNRSGDSVGEAARFYDIDADQIVVVHDDVDLELGRLEIKEGGGHGGHNGLQSLVDALGSSDFVRVRCGVGRPEHGTVSDHVLGKFDGDERSIADELVENAADALEAILRDGPSGAQNRYNGRTAS